MAIALITPQQAQAFITRVETGSANQVESTFAELITKYENEPAESGESIELEIKIREFLENNHSFRKLIDLWDSAYESSRVRLYIESRMQVILLGITDQNLLGNLWRATDAESKPEALVGKRRNQVLHSTLETTTDFGALISMWNWFDKETYEEVLIEHRMEEILIEVNLLSQLSIIYHLTDTNSKPRLLVEARIKTVYEFTVHAITDYNIPEWIIKNVMRNNFFSFLSKKLLSEKLKSLQR